MGTMARRLGATAVAGMMLTGFAVAGPAAAKGSGATIKTGTCSARTDWKLKAKPDDGRLEVEWEIDSTRRGQKWTWTIRHDGKVVHSGSRRTAGRSASFSVERLVRDASGKHTVSATARNTVTGETCRASLRA